MLVTPDVAPHCKPEERLGNASPEQTLCHAVFLLLWILVSGLLFRMFSGLDHEKALSRPCVFNRFSGLGFFAPRGHFADLQPVGGRLVNHNIESLLARPAQYEDAL